MIALDFKSALRSLIRDRSSSLVALTGLAMLTVADNAVRAVLAQSINALKYS